MPDISDILTRMRAVPQSIRFSDLTRVCEYYFGPGRQSGGSHCVYRTPWPGDPRVNIQQSKNGMAKAYQVRQVTRAIDKLQEDGNG